MLDFQKKKQLGILVQIAKVDDDFTDEEKDVIRKIGKQYGATDEEINAILEDPDITESLNPMSVMDKMDFMMDCIVVILADQMVTKSEEYFALQIAKKLAFSPEVVPYLISHENVSREEMRDLMVGYLV